MHALGQPLSKEVRRTGASPWLLIPNRRVHPRARLFCFPHAGGSASVYRAWPQSLPAHVELCAIQLPGRGPRFSEAPIGSWETLLTELSQALIPFLDLPYAFFGHSLGAIVAFELARHLRSLRCAMPRRLWLSSYSPQSPAPKAQPLHTLADEQLIDALRDYEGTPEEILAEPDLIELFLPVLRADFALAETWLCRPELPLPVPITALGGLGEYGPDGAKLLSWQELSSQAFTLRLFSGGHFYLRDHEAQVLALLRQDFEEPRHDITLEL